MTRNHIPLPPTAPRLLIPASSPASQAEAFCLYSPGSALGKLIKKGGICAARTGLLATFGRLFSTRPQSASIAPLLRTLLAENTLNMLEAEWTRVARQRITDLALYLGTPNRYRKVTVLLFSGPGNPIAIAKFASSADARALIRHEVEALSLARRGSLSDHVPRLMGSADDGSVGWLLQSSITGGRQGRNNFNAAYARFLKLMCADGCAEQELSRCFAWTELERTIRDPPAADNPEDSEFLRALTRELGSSLHTLRGQIWPLPQAHGDFVPWNLRETSDGLVAYDWEYYQPTAPAGWDVARFLLMVEHLIARKTLAETTRFLLEHPGARSAFDQWERITGIRIPDRKVLVQLAVLDAASDSSRKQICSAQHS